jgi:hypothetical protein
VEKLIGPENQISVSTRELGTILAALRYWQRQVTDSGSMPDTLPEAGIATDGNTLEPLWSDEIDGLCNRINR